MKKINFTVLLTMILTLMCVLGISASASELTVRSEAMGSYIVGAIENIDGKQYNFTLDETNGWTQTLELPDGSYELASAYVLIGEGSMANCEVVDMFFVPASVAIPSASTLEIDFSTIGDGFDHSDALNQVMGAAPESNVPVEESGYVEQLGSSLVVMARSLPFIAVIAVAGIIFVIATFQYSIKNTSKKEEEDDEN